MRKIKDGNVIYLVKKDKDSLDLRCSNCNIVKSEEDIMIDIPYFFKTGMKVYKCECGCKTFTPQIDLEEYYI